MLERLLPFLVKVSGRGDLAIAVLMLVAVAMMLIPLPTFLVDILITTNIAFSMLILIVALYVESPLQFSAMPSVILIATLFRLAITITTTRLILLQADAGDIVTTFGEFVVGGSIAVGLIVFLIITIAQFVVIAKGSERVAEVAARFTLDALPGKQMSIDAELRNGDIDRAQAHYLRQQLERESQLYGAMDGAMKFVKGDVMAGIIIILINLVGGFTVGMMQHGMSAAEAASTYTLLSVGDGLVAQIPALLVAVSAGVMVTRVSSDQSEGGGLGSQVLSQLTSNSRALGLAAIIMFVLGFVPGFPIIIFAGLALSCAAAAYLARNGSEPSDGPLQRIGDAGSKPPVALQRDEQKPEGPAIALLSSSPLAIRLGSGLATDVPDAELERRISAVRREMFTDLGIGIPAAERIVDDAIPARRVRFDLEGAPILEAEIPTGKFFVDEASEHVDLADVHVDEGPGVAGGKKSLWVDAADAASLTRANIAVLPPLDIIGRWLAHALRQYASHFVGIQETRNLLSEAESEYGDLVRQAQETLPLQKIADVLRRLVSENVPVRNVRLILEALVESGQREGDVVLLTEHVRIALRRQISFRVANQDNVIPAYVLQRPAEDAIRNSIQSSPSGTHFNPTGNQIQTLVAQLQKAQARTEDGALPVVLTSGDVRRHVRSLLVHNGILLPVLSYQELAPEFNVQPLAMFGGTQEAAGNFRGSRPLPATAEAG
ncbi:type III secretion protein V [Mesorhizobium robiniae]|uniref:Type III secretion protein V n=1 Tax=Mesorhizobium robiniae TaxID=559315 RepID=A0ABV2GTD2_9HYPH